MTPQCQTYQSNKPRRTNQMSRLWANGFFRFEVFSGKRSLLPLPRPFCSRPIFPSSFFALAPFSARPECKNSLAVLYFVRLVRERLLRRQSGKCHDLLHEGATLTKWQPEKVLLTQVLTRLKQQVCTETLMFLAARMY